MKDKEFKRLNRAEMVEIIYQLQLDVQKLQQENDELSAKLQSKEIKISEAGSIAEAVVGLSGIFDKAQAAADQYLAELHRSNAELEAINAAKLAQAQAKADAIIRNAEATAAVTIATAEREAAAKWNSVNNKVTQLLQARSELSELLK